MDYTTITIVSYYHILNKFNRLHLYWYVVDVEILEERPEPPVSLHCAPVVRDDQLVCGAKSQTLQIIDG